MKNKCSEPKQEEKNGHSLNTWTCFVHLLPNMGLVKKNAVQKWDYYNRLSLLITYFAS